MNTLFSYENTLYPCKLAAIPNVGDNVFLDFSIKDEKFFIVKMRTFDYAGNQIIISIVKI